MSQLQLELKKASLEAFPNSVLLLTEDGVSIIQSVPFKI